MYSAASNCRVTELSEYTIGNARVLTVTESSVLTIHIAPVFPTLESRKYQDWQFNLL